MNKRPRLLITMGDVAGIGPEIVARAWPALFPLCRPIVVGDDKWMKRGIQYSSLSYEVKASNRLDDLEATENTIPVLTPSKEDLQKVETGKVSGSAGQAAFDFICTAIDLIQSGKADGMVTAPLQKEGLHQAGLTYPGHTEILAEKTGTKEFGMMLYARNEQVPGGLAVVHVTLHCALRDVFAQLSTEAIHEKIILLHDFLYQILAEDPRIAVGALNPHASDGGLFGDEEERLILPAIAKARKEEMDVTGPVPNDFLFVRAKNGEFDGIVALYHDQGHIPMKLLGGFQAVNITLGLPFVRTSVAHGTAYDIAGLGVADPTSLIEATRLAALLVTRKDET